MGADALILRRRSEMRMKVMRKGFTVYVMRSFVALVCAVLLLPSQIIVPVFAQQAQDQPAAKIPADQLDSLVAPIVVYPDNLLSQTLVASTYPLEIMQLQPW